MLCEWCAINQHHLHRLSWEGLGGWSKCGCVFCEAQREMRLVLKLATKELDKTDMDLTP